MEADDAKFLGELARLVNRYGPEPFTRLAAILQNPEQAHQLGVLLHDAARIAGQDRRSKRKRPSPDLGATILRRLRLSDTGKHSAVSLFWRDLISGAILSTMQDIRQFAQMNDLSIGSATSRKAAMVSLLRSLAALPTSEIRELHEALLIHRDDDRSLGRLREAIVRPTKLDNRGTT